MYFETDEDLNEVFKKLTATGINCPPDEFAIFTVTDAGFGVTTGASSDHASEQG
jgi:hypothetical protein